MDYKIKVPAQTIVFRAFDDFDAIMQLTNQLQTLKMVLYGQDNDNIGEFTLRPRPDEAIYNFGWQNPSDDNTYRAYSRTRNLFDSDDE